MRTLGRLRTMRMIPHTVCQSSGPSTSAKTSASLAGLEWLVTACCHSSGEL